MGGQKRRIPDGNSDAAKKKPAASERYERDQVASTSRRAEPAYPEDGRAARDQQRTRDSSYGGRRDLTEIEHYNQYHGYYRHWDTRRHRESANRYPNPYNNYRGRPHQRGFRGKEFYDGGHYRKHSRSQSSRQQSDNRERQRQSPDQRETVRKPHRNISRSGSSRDREMQGSQELSTSNRPISRSPGQDSNSPTRRVSNENASHQPVPQPSSPGQSSSMGSTPSVMSDAGENQPEQRSQNTVQDPVPAVVPTTSGRHSVQPSRYVPLHPVPAAVPTGGGSQALQPSRYVPQDPVPAAVPTTSERHSVQPSRYVLQHPVPAAVPTASGSQAVQPSQNVSQNPVPPVVPTAGGSQAVQPSQNVPQGPPPSVMSDAGENQPEQRSQNQIEFETKFRLSIRESPCLYDPSDVGFRNKTRSKKSWTGVSSACKMSVRLCKDKFEQRKSRYRRLKRLSADNGSLSDPEKQFIEDWSFIPYQRRDQRRTTTEHTRPTVNPTANQTRPSSGPRCVVPRHPPSSNSGNRMNNSRPDPLFPDDMLAAIQNFSPAQKSEFNSSVWKVISQIQRRADA